MSMNLTFCGAAATVTGSAYWFAHPEGQFLVDCGLFQGTKTVKELNYGDFPFDPTKIDFVLLTHAHIDHSGLIPKLVKQGFAGPIYATEATRDLLSYMLPDSAYIQETEVDRLNRRNRQRGRPTVEPIYTRHDVERSLSQFRTVEYDAWIEVVDGIKVRFWNAGHHPVLKVIKRGNDGVGRRQVCAQRPYVPFPEPHATWALALNYKLHIEETGLTTSPDYPHIFLRMPICQVGHNQALWAPNLKIAECYDYEAELAIVIGTPGRHIKKENALSHVAGYSCYNEGSVREYQGQNRQFGLGKNFERSGSFGPWLVTPDEFGDPADHTVTFRLNGIERQKAKVDGMLFDCAHLISYLSEGYTLQPGDVIVTGSPGALPLQPGEKPEKPMGPVVVDGQLHMRAGDLSEVEIDGIGILSNPVIEDPTPLP
ncbi:MAG: fumarylacetoacetate hydrolase family protein [Proteobacteria bacterium]|nr:fumarylacetoacetate hydrolase family protein [Pseudomonadota bacterium]